jgi:hypothetical protein
LKESDGSITLENMYSLDEEIAAVSMQLLPLKALLSDVDTFRRVDMDEFRSLETLQIDVIRRRDRAIALLEQAALTSEHAQERVEVCKKKGAWESVHQWMDLLENAQAVMRTAAGYMEAHIEEDK